MKRIPIIQGDSAGAMRRRFLCRPCSCSFARISACTAFSLPSRRRSRSRKFSAKCSALCCCLARWLGQALPRKSCTNFGPNQELVRLKLLKYEQLVSGREPRFRFEPQFWRRMLLQERVLLLVRCHLAAALMQPPPARRCPGDLRDGGVQAGRGAPPGALHRRLGPLVRQGLRRPRELMRLCLA